MIVTANKTFFEKKLGHRYIKGLPYKLDTENDPEFAKVVDKWILSKLVTVVS